MSDYIQPAVRAHFRKWAASTNAEHIKRIWLREGFDTKLKPASHDGRAIWRSFEEAVDWRDPSHSDRALRVFEALIAHDDGQAVDMHRGILRIHGWDIDPVTRLVMRAGK